MGLPFSATAGAAEGLSLPAVDGDIDDSYNSIPVRGLRPDVSRQDKDRLSSTIDVSIESHMMGFAAERSRKSGKKEKV